MILQKQFNEDSHNSKDHNKAVRYPHKSARSRVLSSVEILATSSQHVLKIIYFLVRKVVNLACVEL